MTENSKPGHIDQGKQTLVAQGNLLLENLTTVSWGSMLTAVAMVLILSDAVDKTILIPWISLFFLLTLARTRHYRGVREMGLSADNINKHISIFALFASMAGCLWGFISLHGITTEQPTTSIVVVMILTGMVASATATMSHIPKIYLLFTFATLVPAAYKFSTFGQSNFYWVSILIVLFLAISWINSRTVRASIMQSIRLRYQNLDLIEDLVTENHRAEAALAQVEHASMAKSRFFAAASHDLRQPLHSLRLFTATLQSQNVEPEQQQVVSQIDASVNALEELFNTLLDISSLDAGTLKVEKQHFHLDSLLAPMINELTALADEKGLELIVELTDTTLYSDPVLLRRVIRNLADNALRYTTRGSVTISAREKYGLVNISVSDTGKGIPEKQKHSIFDEFVQLDNPERDRSRGLGLGLAIVKRIADLLHMDLHLDSMEGKGTTITVAVDKGDDTLAVKGAMQTNNTHAALSDLFVLIIDDEETVRIALEGLLETWGCVVMVAGSEEEALAQLREFDQEPDIILSDYRLRNNETGGNAVNAIRSLYGKDIPAVIVTGDIAPDRLIEIAKLGMPTLHKPVDPEQLRGLMGKMTGNSRAHVGTRE